MTQEEKKPENQKSLNDRLMKALKAVNTLSGRSLEEADLKKHRRTSEWAGRLAAPKGNIVIQRFMTEDIPCEEVTPEFAHNPHFAILYVHGGGYISGGLGYSRILAAKMAVATGFTTFSFEYRLAPEHPYPAQLTDAMSVWDYLTAERYRPDHILLAGDSAGGNMALCMVQKMKTESRELPGNILLFSPWTDMTGTAASYETNKETDPILTREYITDAAKAYIAGAGEPEEPRFSPLYGDFSDFPPVLIMAGKNEILLDDSIRLKERIESVGGKVRLDIEEKGWHVYQQMPIRIADRAMKRLSAYVSARIYGQ